MYIGSYSAVFDANGIARTEAGPTIYGVEWTVESMTTNVSGSALKPTLDVYLQTETPTAAIAHSRDATRDTNDDERRLRNLEKLVFVWRNGTPGAVAVIVLEGEIERAI